jgi:hypothetical protein
MANQNKLKAYVRYDGTGRVIAGGPILQRFKPAVGNWVEINANECCNEIPTTTTTTTQGGGGVTPTAWVGSTSFTLEGACAGGGLTYIFYTSTSTLGIGTTLWENAALTIPLFGGTITQSWIIVNGNVYQLGSQGGNVVINGQGICSTTTTTTTSSGLFSISGIYSASNGGAICSNPINLFSPVPNPYCTTPTLQNGSYLYIGNGTGNPIMGGLYISNAQGVVFQTSYDNPGQLISFPCF